MSSKIIARRAGTTVDLYIDTSSYQRVYDTEEAAKAAFQEVLKVKANLTDDAVKALKAEFDPNTQFEVIGGLRKNGKNQYFIEGVDVPLPHELMLRMKTQLEANEPIDNLVNFWKWLCLNPDKHVRSSLFKFMDRFKMPITDKGYFIAYKSVAWVGVKNKALAELISSKYVYKKAHGKNPADILIYEAVDEEGEGINKYFYVDLAVEEDIKEEDFIETVQVPVSTKELLLMSKKEIEALEEVNGVMHKTETVGHMPILHGDVETLFPMVAELFDQDDSVFTDWHTMKTTIKLGTPSMMPRKDCDNNENETCSSGLHVGAPGYVASFGRNSQENVILACLVNPMNVVAIPRDYNFEKMRCCEYLPYAICEMKEGKIVEIDSRYFEEDYTAYQVDELNAMLEELEKEGDPTAAMLALGTIIRDRLVVCKQ